MRYTTLFLLAICFLMGACQNSANQSNSENPNSFGEEITAEGSVDLATVLPKLASVDSVQAKLTGKVESVCQVKGCWMNVLGENGEEMFVQFEDYGFFMPLDCAGKNVVMDGYAYRSVTTVDELRHFAEDEGQTAEEIAAITEPEEELKFMATGVILVQ